MPFLIDFNLLKTNFSELTCNNCSFWVFSDNNGDSFIPIRGNASVKNLIDIKIMNLVQDSIIFSCSTLQNEITSIEEKTKLNSLLINFDEMAKEENEELTINNKLEIRLKNIRNIERIIYLNYSKNNSEK